jgi:hypothetical protein
MDELKLLAEMVANLPAMALWVIAFFFGYKVVVVGSIYGVIRFVAQKAHESIVFYKSRPKEVQEIHKIRDITITECMDDLIRQLRRVAGKRVYNGSQHIHPASVDWLSEAITDKIAKDEAEAAKKKAA